MTTCTSSCPAGFSSRSRRRSGPEHDCNMNVLPARNKKTPNGLGVFVSDELCARVRQCCTVGETQVRECCNSATVPMIVGTRHRRRRPSHVYNWQRRPHVVAVDHGCRGD